MPRGPNVGGGATIRLAPDSITSAPDALTDTPSPGASFVRNERSKFCHLSDVFCTLMSDALPERKYLRRRLLLLVVCLCVTYSFNEEMDFWCATVMGS